MIHTFDQSLVLVRFASQSGSPPAARRNRSRAGALGLPPAIAIIGGERRASRHWAELYREAGRRAGVAADKFLVGIIGVRTEERLDRGFGRVGEEAMTITIAPLMPMAVGDQLQAAILRSIELLGTVVAPQVRAEFAKRSVSA
jgi:hypothetical protein